MEVRIYTSTLWMHVLVPLTIQTPFSFIRSFLLRKSRLPHNIIQQPCTEVFVSCNAIQSHEIPNNAAYTNSDEYPTLTHITCCHTSSNANFSSNLTSTYSPAIPQFLLYLPYLVLIDHRSLLTSSFIPS